MAAPAEIIVHGTASLRTVVDEPSSSPTVLVESISRKGAREDVQIKNTRRTTVRVKRVNPILTLSFKGEIAQESGLAVLGPGKAVASLANFAGVYREFDPSTGTLVLGDPEDEVEVIEDRPMTTFDVVHFPYVVTA